MTYVVVLLLLAGAALALGFGALAEFLLAIAGIAAAIALLFALARRERDSAR
jgi:hypothetical protein